MPGIFFESLDEIRKQFFPYVALHGCAVGM